MDENNYDFNNSMDEEEKIKAIEEANNTMISENKEMQIKNKKKKEKKSKKDKKDKKENKISNIVNEINDELEEYNNLDIENIFEINNNFNYPKDFPVFYLQDESNDNNENSLFKEPLSTNKIKELLKAKQIKPYLINVKLIDIFSMKNHSPFSFFPLNEILEKNWSKNVEYSTLFIQAHNKLKEKEDKKIEKIPKKIEKREKKEKIPKKKEEDITLNLNFSEINKSGFNDLSMSIIKQLEGINLTKKQVEKITSIIEEVEEDEWQEVKSKKKENENNISIGIVGLTENKQNKKNNKIPKKKKNYINDNNQFKGLKIDYDD